jgi:hypothetical protein
VGFSLAFDTAEISDRLTHLAQLVSEADDEALIRSALNDVGHIQQWIDNCKVSLTRKLQVLATTMPRIQPQQVLASAANISRIDAFREVSRAKTLGAFPQLEHAFEQGRIGSAHIDAVVRATHQLTEEEKAKLASRSDWLNNVATHATPDNFARAVKSEVARIHADGGVTRLERQRRDASLRHWIDRESGMFHIAGRLDPENGLRVIGKLDNTVERLFHAALPDTCPTDDRKHGHLTALAFLELIDAASLGAPLTAGAMISSPHARAEVSVVIDLHTLRSGLHEHSVIRTGHEAELPLETIRRMACEAEIIPVVLNTKGVVIDIGRASRLATRYQRKAIEAMYTHCAIPDCKVPIAQCQPHHIAYWRDDGPTNMNNLVPLCTHHHRKVHEGNWRLKLSLPNRVLTVTYPDGHVSTACLTNSKPQERIPHE